MQERTRKTQDKARETTWLSSTRTPWTALCLQHRLDAATPPGHELEAPVRHVPVQGRGRKTAESAATAAHSALLSPDLHVIRWCISRLDAAARRPPLPSLHRPSQSCLPANRPSGLSHPRPYLHPLSQLSPALNLRRSLDGLRLSHEYLSMELERLFIEREWIFAQTPEEGAHAFTR